MEDKKDINRQTIFLVVVIVLALIGIVVGLLMKGKTTYESPIATYYAGLNAHDTKEVLKAYPECIRKHPGFVIRVEQGVKPSQDNKLKYEYKILSKRDLSKEEIKKEQDAYDSTCEVNEAIIEEAYFVKVRSTEKYPNNEDNTHEIEIKVGKVKGEWYILE